MPYDYYKACREWRRLDIALVSTLVATVISCSTFLYLGYRAGEFSKKPLQIEKIMEQYDLDGKKDNLNREELSNFLRDNRIIKGE